jgi:hypothetical protein
MVEELSIVSSCFFLSNYHFVLQIPNHVHKQFHHPGDFDRTQHKRSEPIHYCFLWLILLAFDRPRERRGIAWVSANNLDIIRYSSVSSPLYPLLYQLIPVDNHGCSSICCAVERECGFGATFFLSSLFAVRREKCRFGVTFAVHCMLLSCLPVQPFWLPARLPTKGDK